MKNVLMFENYQTGDVEVHKIDGCIKHVYFRYEQEYDNLRITVNSGEISIDIRSPGNDFDVLIRPDDVVVDYLVKNS